MSDSDLVAFLRACLDQDERVARAASGGTVVGSPGAWVPSPDGDEWEACSSDGDTELLVALRPGLPRPPDVMSGMWGAVVSSAPDDTDPDAWSPMPQFEHAARHDPARVLADIAAKRQIILLHETTVEKIDAAPFDSHTGERLPDEYDVTCALCGWVSDDPTAGCLTLRLLALPYAAVEGYRPEWAPDA